MHSIMPERKKEKKREDEKNDNKTISSKNGKSAQS